MKLILENYIMCYALSNRLKVAIYFRNDITENFINVDQRAETVEVSNHQKYRSFLQRNLLSLFGKNYKVPPKKNDDSSISVPSITPDVKFVTYSSEFSHYNISAALGIYPSTVVVGSPKGGGVAVPVMILFQILALLRLLYCQMIP